MAYFALAGSLAYATDDWNLARWRKAALVIAIVALYGIGMEAGQHFAHIECPSCSLTPPSIRSVPQAS